MSYKYKLQYTGAEIDTILAIIHDNNVDWENLNAETKKKIEDMIKASVNIKIIKGGGANV